MTHKMNRRDFLAASGGAALVLSPFGAGVRDLFAQGVPAVTTKGAISELFDYSGVKSRRPAAAFQHDVAMEYLLSASDDENF